MSTQTGTSNALALRHQKLKEYLDSLRSEAETGVDFTESALDISWQVWERLKEYFQSQHSYLDIPDACPGYRDNLMYTWSQEAHYFECEIFGNGEVEFFYRNRENNEVWGEDTRIDQKFSRDILDKASLFIVRPKPQLKS